MKCPRCAENTPDSWSPWSTRHGAGYRPVLDQPGRKGLAEDGQIIRLPDSQIQIDWMKCANTDCAQIVIRAHEGFRLPGQMEETTKTWLVYPRMAQRPIDPLVQGAVREDYTEAAAILELSPRMSAVMSRRILADLLQEHAKQDQFRLEERIDGFVTDTQHPSQLREGLHYFREAANFGAHTQTDDQGEIIDIGREEAEWTLDLLDRLFDYFIVAPEKDRQMQAAMAAKIEAAGRKAIKPLPDSTETS